MPANGGERGFAVWVVGLPGCGKSNLARGLKKELEERGFEAVWLQMDERRKAYFPEPKYTREEREQAYELFVKEAADLARSGKAVVMDGAAYKVSMREYARELIEDFAEVHVVCSLQTAIERESSRPEGLVMAGLYKKAIRRKETGEQFEGLGEVIGVDVDFEENPDAEFRINNEDIPKQETLRRTLQWLDGWLKEKGLTVNVAGR
jgi:adenylylsulfate kinase